MTVFPVRWKNWWVRGILTLAMISFFFFIIYLGPMVLMMIVSSKTWLLLLLLLFHSSSFSVDSLICESLRAGNTEAVSLSCTLKQWQLER